jgi:hypothetical protein
MKRYWTAVHNVRGPIRGVDLPEHVPQETSLQRIKILERGLFVESHFLGQM